MRLVFVCVIQENTALILAARYQPEAVQPLLDAKSDVTATNKYQVSAAYFLMVYM